MCWGVLGGVFFLAFVREESEGEEKGGGARAGRSEERRVGKECRL